MLSTKQLARELGLLRKKRLPSAPSGATGRKHLHNQIFSFLVVLDFESTCWENGRHRTNEIIEFPAVLMNTRTGEIESEFHYYVQPQENPVLSDFCRQLTGITQAQVEDGIPLRLCLQKFGRWLAQLAAEKGVGFSSPAPSGQANAAFVTWSDWDLGVCLLYECRRKQIIRPSALNCWIDLRLSYRKFYDRRPKGLNGALQDVGISFEGREHSGLHDARNTARLAWRMIQDGCVLQITKSLPASSGSEPNSHGQGGLTTRSRLDNGDHAQDSKNHPKPQSAEQGKEINSQMSSSEPGKGQLLLPPLNKATAGLQDVSKKELTHISLDEHDQCESVDLNSEFTTMGKEVSPECNHAANSETVRAASVLSEGESLKSGKELEQLEQFPSSPHNKKEMDSGCGSVCSKEKGIVNSQASVLLSSFVEGCEDFSAEKHQDSGCMRDLDKSGLTLHLPSTSSDLEQITSHSQLLVSSFVEGDGDSGFDSAMDSPQVCLQEALEVQELLPTVQVSVGLNQGGSKLGTLEKRSLDWSTPPPAIAHKFLKMQTHSPSPPVRVGLQMRNMNLCHTDTCCRSSVQDIIRNGLCDGTTVWNDLSSHSARQGMHFKMPSPVHDVRGRQRSNQGPLASTPKLTGRENHPCVTTKGIRARPPARSSGNIRKNSSPLERSTTAQTSGSNSATETPVSRFGKSGRNLENRWGNTPGRGFLLPTSTGSRSSAMKRTPPLCQCGRRSHRRMVQTPGPNQGRFFFSCPDRRAPGMGGNSKTGCGFFQWEGNGMSGRDRRH